MKKGLLVLGAGRAGSTVVKGAAITDVDARQVHRRRPNEQGMSAMPVTTIDGRQIAVDPEGFMTEYAQWDEALGRALAAQIGIDLTDQHWEAVQFLRQDFAVKGVTPTLRRVSVMGAIPTRTLFQLFPQKPAKKMAYIAGLPKPQGCV